MDRELNYTLRSMLQRLSRRFGTAVVDGFFNTASRVGKLHPHARPGRHGVEHLRDIRYKDGEIREHLLDIYRPLEEGSTRRHRRYAGPPWPVLVYVHGGGFRILSKDTHW